MPILLQAFGNKIFDEFIRHFSAQNLCLRTPVTVLLCEKNGNNSHTLRKCKTHIPPEMQQTRITIQCKNLHDANAKHTADVDKKHTRFVL